ncbi:hypothetical protein Tco_0600258 [Tanacetum coccineum]|uniref:Uncharacterized protein n=1 Tax=Tanacetum coccineum TaxID=301880 RepID=A0ABQ4WBB6_9ASTR
MMVQAPEDMGEDSAAPNDSHSIPIITQPSSSKPQKKQSRRKQRKDSGPTEPILDEYSEKVLIWRESKEFIRYAQAKEIATSKVESSNDVSLGAQEDASKQGRKIADLDSDEEVTLIDETHERNNEEMLFDVQDDLQSEEVVAKKEVAEKEVSATDPVTTAGEVVTTANVEVTTASAPTITIDELTLAQTLIEIKVAKPKAVTNAATITTTTRPKTKGVVVQELSEFKTTSNTFIDSQFTGLKDKGALALMEVEKDDDQEEAEMKKHIDIVKDDEVTIDAIPLATKPPMIVEYKIVKEGKFRYFQLIRADGSLKRYLSMIKMLQNIDREDLETL